MSDRQEPDPITGEVPVSLTIMASINIITTYYLKIKGIFYILIGLSWLLIASPSRLEGIEWLSFLTSDMVGWAWLFAGILSSGSGFIKSDGFRRLGFFMLILIPAVIGGYFLVSQIIAQLNPESAVGYDRAAITSVSYWAYSASAYLMARIYAQTLVANPVPLPGGTT